MEGFRELAIESCRVAGIEGWMINATCEVDWPAVAALAQTVPGALPSFGLHPWFQKQRTPHWAEALEQILRLHPQAGIGETGLDRWMPEHDLEDQTRVLEEHLELSRVLERPLSLHCLKAWPELKGVLQRHPKLPRGFLLHSYAAPPDMTPFWIQEGAYFSFSPGFLHPRKSHIRRAFTQIPLERLLLETDAPDMAPPKELALANVPSSTGEDLNHPVNLRLCLTALATDRQMSEDSLATTLWDNTRRFWGF